MLFAKCLPFSSTPWAAILTWVLAGNGMEEGGCVVDQGEGRKVVQKLFGSHSSETKNT